MQSKELQIVQRAKFKINKKNYLNHLEIFIDISINLFFHPILVKENIDLSH